MWKFLQPLFDQFVRPHLEDLAKKAIEAFLKKVASGGLGLPVVAEETVSEAASEAVDEFLK